MTNSAPSTTQWIYEKTSGPLAYVLFCVIIYACLWSFSGKEALLPTCAIHQHHYAVCDGAELNVVIFYGFAVLAGKLSERIRLPGFVGMLLSGCALHYISFSNPRYRFLPPPVVKVEEYASNRTEVDYNGTKFARFFNVDKNISAILRQIALTTFLIREGLRFDPAIVRRAAGGVARMALIPCLTEAFSTMVISKLLLNWSWSWAAMLGFVLAAISPDVVVPNMIRLEEAGLGVTHGIPTITMAACSIDDLVTIMGFGVAFLFAFSKIKILDALGPLHSLLVVVGGAFVGLSLGFLLWFLPQPDIEHGTVMRACCFFFVPAAMICGSASMNVPLTGVLGCILFIFTVTFGWERGWPWRLMRDKEQILNSNAAHQSEITNRGSVRAATHGVQGYWTLHLTQNENNVVPVNEPEGGAAMQFAWFLILAAVSVIPYVLSSPLYFVGLFSFLLLVVPWCVPPELGSAEAAALAAAKAAAAKAAAERAAAAKAAAERAAAEKAAAAKAAAERAAAEKAAAEKAAAEKAAAEKAAREKAAAEKAAAEKAAREAAEKAAAEKAAAEKAAAEKAAREKAAAEKAAAEKAAAAKAAAEKAAAEKAAAEKAAAEKAAAAKAAAEKAAAKKAAAEKAAAEKAAREKAAAEKAAAEKAALEEAAREKAAREKAAREKAAAEKAAREKAAAEKAAAAKAAKEAKEDVAPGHSRLKRGGGGGKDMTERHFDVEDMDDNNNSVAAWINFMEEPELNDQGDRQSSRADSAATTTACQHGMDCLKTMRSVVDTVWWFVQPLLFALIGEAVPLYTSTFPHYVHAVGLGIVVVCSAIIIRLVATYYAVRPTLLTDRERIFVAIAWMPKATVQAAICGLALDAIRKNDTAHQIDWGASRNTSFHVLYERSQQIGILAIVCILITAPLGTILMRLTAHRLLTQDRRNDSWSRRDE